MDPTQSSELAATAVEVVHGQPPSSFAHGLFVGVAATVVLVQAWLAVELAELPAMYRDFTAELPPLTWLATSRGWRWGVPLAGAVAVVALVARRPRRTWWYAAVAAVLVGMAVGTWWFAQAPIRELAGTIQD